MTGTARRRALFDELAVVGKALGSPRRLELMDLLAQGERTVDSLARAADLGVTTVSAHLQVLKMANMVRTRRQGTRIFYRLAGDDVADLYDRLRTLAVRRSADVERARAAYLELPSGGEVGTVTREELVRLMQQEAVTLLDVRPREEYAAAHIPGAVSTPLDEVLDLAPQLGDRRPVVAYCRGSFCVMAHDAVRLLGLPGRGGHQARGRDAGVAHARSPGRDRRRGTGVTADVPRAWTALRSWSARRWLAAAAGATAFLVVVAVPTDLIEPGLRPGDPATPLGLARPGRVLGAGRAARRQLRGRARGRRRTHRSGGGRPPRLGRGLLTYFAVGCPVCNKLVLLALGSAGAVTWFEPVQPALQAVAVALLLWALRGRLRGELACPTDLDPGPQGRRPEQDHACRSPRPRAGHRPQEPGRAAGDRRRRAGRRGRRADRRPRLGRRRHRTARGRELRERRAVAAAHRRRPAARAPRAGRPDGGRRRRRTGGHGGVLATSSARSAASSPATPSPSWSGGTSTTARCASSGGTSPTSAPSRSRPPTPAGRPRLRAGSGRSTTPCTPTSGHPTAARLDEDHFVSVAPTIGLDIADSARTCTPGPSPRPSARTSGKGSPSA